ncbi:protein FAM98A-like isoform X2 [Babylonia areolata]|uniref:protein FAM98A-like isoform X2 n=1 Tax=Babylonia areolata TaxID=304850 RepID=UPI003FD4707B
MENDVLDALEDLGYTGPLSDLDALAEAVEEGPTSVTFTQLVEWLVQHIADLTGVEERVHAITCPDDASSFLLEVSGFLREYGCVYPDLTEGPVSDRLSTPHKCLQLLDFLTCELQAVRMIAKKKPTMLHPAGTQGPVATVSESEVAGYMKRMLMGLGFPRPPDNITIFTLFSKLEAKIKELMGQYPGQISKPLLKARLSDKQWDSIMEINEAMSQEYRIRREMLLKRLDVTIHSFKWSDKAKRNEAKINDVYDPIQKALQSKTSIGVPDILAAREGSRSRRASMGTGATSTRDAILHET